MAWIAAIVTTAASIAYSEASQPTQPNIANSSKELSNANAALLPIQRELEAAAAKGAVAYNPGYSSKTITADEAASLRATAQANLARLQQQLDAARLLPTTGHDTQVRRLEDQVKEATANLAAIPQAGGTVYVDGNGNVVSQGRAVLYDFRGYSQADAAKVVSEKMAQATLELQQKYDPQFIDEALKQEALADPEGVAARARMNELIQQQINAKPDRPVADLMNRQVGGELKAAQSGHLDADMKSVLDDAVLRASADRGGSAMNPSADFEQPLVTGFEGEQRQQAANQKALSWLSSGATPEDTEYRREQQNLANLSAQINGTTPQSQFSSLSGAQQGATPQGLTQPNLSQLPTNTSSVAANGAINAYTAQLQQTPSWLAGLSALASATSSTVKATA